MNEFPTWIIMVWIICIFALAIITYKIYKDSKRNDDYFKRNDRMIDDFFTPWSKS
ncbi:MAG: hypothetical protein NTW78_04005 [Campylobacterales bacterium]|nr:hypothetical protein [Campylobacterales bacterium]